MRMASGFNGFSREIKFLAADELLKKAHPSTDFSQAKETQHQPKTYR
jgi:hypothetical protein